MTIRGVIFDLGHTLMHLDGAWPEVFEQGVADLAAYLQSREPALDGEAFARALLDRRAEGFSRARDTMREVTARSSMRWTFARFGQPDPDPDLVEGAIDAFFSYEYDCWQADPDALAVLRELAGRGLRLGLYSNASHDPFIQRLVDRFGFRPWLDPALSSAGTGICKPDPEAFKPIPEAWDLPAASVVMVGDTMEADVLGAHRAGMLSVWFQSRPDARQEGGEAHDGAPIAPGATIHALRELPRALTPWLAPS